MYRRKPLNEILREMGKSSFILKEGDRSYQIYLDKEHPVAGDGGTCIVYNAWKECVDSEGTSVKRRIILKEFYPELKEDIRDERISEDVPSVLGDNDEYKNKLCRFKKSYDIFVKLYNGSTNNNTVNACELIKSNNTWYIIVDFNNATSLKAYMEAEGITLYDVTYALMKTAEVVHSLHTFCENSYDEKGEEDGYLHLDLTPSNILYIAKDRYARIMDTDSFIKKSEIWDDEVEIIFSKSEGYTSPEQESGSRYRLSEKSDIYSLGAIMYEYLVGKKAIAIGPSMHKEELEKELDEGILKRYSDCSRKARKQIREFIYNTIVVERSKRYDSMAEVAAVLSDICKQVDPQDVYIREDYRANEKPVYGRERKIEELEKAFAKQKSANRIVCISGMGGIGKSTLARAYAQKYREYYDVITEVYSDNAEGALAGVNLLNYPQDIEVDIRLSKLSELVAKQKTLIIVNDYNTDIDETFEKFRNMQCDIVLTNWNDMSDIVPTIQLGSEDLSSDEAADIFMLHYTGNIGEGEEKSRVIEQIKELNKLVNNHPLSIELLAKQMSYRKGSETTLQDMIDELKDSGIVEYKRKKIYNVKDGKKVEQGDVCFHLDIIFGRALDKGELDEEELEILRYMTLTSSVYGICEKRMEEWTGMGKDVPDILHALKCKGWLEYHKDGRDLLYTCDKEIIGTFHMAMVVQETLCKRERMKSTIDNCKSFVEAWKNIVSNARNDKKEDSRKYLQIKEQGIMLVQRIVKECSIGYLDLIDTFSVVPWLSIFHIKEEINGRIYYCLPFEVFRRTLEKVKESLHIIEEMCEMSDEEKHLIKRLAKTYSIIGNYHNIIAKSVEYNESMKYYDESMKFFEKAIEVLEKNKIDEEICVQGLGILYGNVGHLCLKQGKIERGLIYYKKGVERLERCGRDEEIPESMIVELLHDYKNVIELHSSEVID